MPLRSARPGQTQCPAWFASTWFPPDNHCECGRPHPREGQAGQGESLAMGRRGGVVAEPFRIMADSGRERQVCRHQEATPSRQSRDGPPTPCAITLSRRQCQPERQPNARLLPFRVTRSDGGTRIADRYGVPANSSFRHRSEEPLPRLSRTAERVRRLRKDRICSSNPGR
jgi:hypothetical protein